VDAGAVFRDLCAGLDAVRLTVNLRVAREPEAQRILGAATAVNAGSVEGTFSHAVVVRRTVKEVSFQGVEHLARNWSEVAHAALDRWWASRGVPGEAFVRGASRTYRLRAAGFDEADRVELRSLFVHHTRARILCATRAFGLPTSAETINAHLLDRLRESLESRSRPRVPGQLWPGCPVLVQRNDYVRGLYNGDQGVIVTVDAGDGAGPRLMAVFARGSGFEAMPAESVPDLAPSFAMTVHKAQGSEFDDIVLVLPESDMPLLTRELVYTAITRARRSALLIGSTELLARAVARTSVRYSGVAERLRPRPSGKM
jgi:exodeoxyribonuclease V alpha subunit